MVNIYTLTDPITNEIRYVGKTEKNLQIRLRNHLNKNDNTHVRCWIKKLKKLGIIPIIESIDEVPEKEWQFWEQFYISLFKNWGFNLTNHTIGGDGCRIGHHSKETKDKISKMRKIQGSPWMKNRYITEETKEKTSNTLKGRTLSDERIKKSGDGHKKKIKQYNNDGEYIDIFDSAKDAKDKLNLNIHHNNIQMCATGKCRSAGGFIWRYENDEFNKFETKIYSKLMKPVIQYDLDGNFINEWVSASEASRKLKIIVVSIINCSNGKQKTGYGFKWKWKNKN